MFSVLAFTSALLELPRLAAHGAVCFGALLLNPLQDAVQMEYMVALTPYCENPRLARKQNRQRRRCALGGQSSPGFLQSTQYVSKVIRHMPHESSCTSHRQAATACHLHQRRGRSSSSPPRLGSCTSSSSTSAGRKAPSVVSIWRRTFCCLSRHCVPSNLRACQPNYLHPSR
jgi:hypothetical protein